MKKTLALLLAVLMMVSVIPFAAAADCEHANTEAWFAPDGNGNHSTKKCVDCGELLDTAACTSSGAVGEGVCDWCGTAIPAPAPAPTPAPCQHDNTVDWFEADGKGYHSTSKCSDCGEVLGKEKCASSGAITGDTAKEICDWCGTKIPEVLKPSKPSKPGYDYYDDYYKYDRDGHWVVIHGLAILSTYERHNFNTSGRCRECGYRDVNYKYNKYDKYNYGFNYGKNYGYGYSDVDSNAWYASAVKYVTNYEIMEGKSYNKFAPESNMTRAALAEALYAISGAKASGTENFSDVDRYDDYYEAVVWCAKKGIIEGWNGKFVPSGDITREDFAVMMYRFAKVERLNTKAYEDLDQFSDADDVSDYAVEALEWAVAEGLINGMGDGTLAPQGTTSRAQAAAILMRLCKNVK